MSEMTGAEKGEKDVENGGGCRGEGEGEVEGVGVEVVKAEDLR